MKLKVISHFRDINNFFVEHKVGDEITVNDAVRAASLINGGFCEEISEVKKETETEMSESAHVAEEAESVKSEVKPSARKPRKNAK